MSGRRVTAGSRRPPATRSATSACWPSSSWCSTSSAAAWARPSRSTTWPTPTRAPTAGRWRRWPSTTWRRGGRRGWQRSRTRRFTSTPEAPSTTGRDREAGPEAEEELRAALDRLVAGRRAHLRRRDRARRGAAGQPAAREDEDAGTHVHAGAGVGNGYRDFALKRLGNKSFG